MSKYKIIPDAYLRLSKLVDFFPSHMTEERREKLRYVMIQNKGGEAFAVASNARVAAVEYMGSTEGEDGVVFLPVNDEIKRIADEASKQNIWIELNIIPELGIDTMNVGRAFMNNTSVFIDDSPLLKWPSWFTKSPDASKGIMMWDLFAVESLIRSSPSGIVVFPEFIDNGNPVMLRDRHKDGWVGFFIPSGQIPGDMERSIKQKFLPRGFDHAV